MAQSSENKAGSSIKILSVVWYKVLPPKFGGQNAVAFFNETLAQQSELICLCSRNNEAVASGYKIYPVLPTSKLQFINPFIWRRIYLFAKKQKITHLLLEFPYYGIAGFICKTLLGIKLVVNTHNIEFKRFKEAKKWWWGPLYHFEKWTLGKADAVFFKTKEDKKLAAQQFGLEENKLEIISYGVNEPTFFSKDEAQAIVRAKHQIHKDDCLLLFAGTLDYAPNADALVAISDKIIPLLNEQSFPYKIIVCGRNKLKQFQYLNGINNPSLVLAGEVEDIDLYFKAADVFINPVISGGGIQTKIMDALSYRLNVVCLESKRSGIEHADNKIYSAANDSWEDFASAIIEASKNNEPTAPAFFQIYNWRTIAAKAYKKILAC